MHVIECTEPSERACVVESECVLGQGFFYFFNVRLANVDAKNDVSMLAHTF